MSRHGMIRGALSSIVKYLSSAFDALRKNIPTFSSNVRQSAPKNSGSKTPGQQSPHGANSKSSSSNVRQSAPKNSGSKTPGHRTSHEANSKSSRKPRVKSLGHYEEAHKRAENQGLDVLHEELNVLQGTLNWFEKKTKKKPRKGQRPQRQQSSPPRGNSGFFKFW